MKVVRLSALRTGRLYSPGDIPGTHFCEGLSAAGRIMSMKNSNDTIGNRTHKHKPFVFLTPEVGTGRLYRNVGKKLQLLVT